MSSTARTTSKPAQTNSRVDSHYKDAILDRLAAKANVAQFVSFSPGANPQVRFARIRGIDAHHRFGSIADAVRALFDRSDDGSVNVRSFEPTNPKARPFRYGIRTPTAAVREVRRLASQGLYTIVNETIDVKDGGVSGVAYAGILECAPDDTPRAVEKPGVAQFGLELGLKVLELVYGFRPDLDYRPEQRVEFSIHPLRRGARGRHTIIWELERAEPIALQAQTTWPNQLSRFLGDKVFGLLVAAASGLPVPMTTVISRRVAPFTFGSTTSSGEHWIRTSPTEQVPGRFTTKRGWIDPYQLMADEDPNGDQIASILAQEGVDALYSGAAAIGADSELIIEGVAGSGEAFMQGQAAPVPLPLAVVEDVRRTQAVATEKIGPVRCEWVHDGRSTWIVQMHAGQTPSVGNVVFPGVPTAEHTFYVRDGLEALRSLVEQVRGTGEGIVLIGQVGLTSHFGDVLRRARVPSRIQLPAVRS